MFEDNLRMQLKIMHSDSKTTLLELLENRSAFTFRLFLYRIPELIVYFYSLPFLVGII